jgi:uncharacterized protein YcbK (DUF882 family)
MQRLLYLMLLLSFAASAQEETRTLATFAAWKSHHHDAVLQFHAHLQSNELHEVVELPELLKSASSWERCQAEPYAIPPQSQWPAVLSVLKLVRELRGRGVLGRFVVHSGYRGAELNVCADGAERSAHLRSFAIDLTPLDSEDPTDKLCAFWREHGREWRMGFSRYRSGRLHIDTSGYRTWGTDHTGKSAVCGAA